MMIPPRVVVTAIVPAPVTGELLTVNPEGIVRPTEVTVPPVFVMVIEPAPLVMLIPVPAVRLALFSVLVLVFPISSWPLV